MNKAKTIISKDFNIGKTDDRLFGSFVEHMGSVVYNGIYEPDHPTADENGFRKDVLQLVKDLQLGVIRYPGGNFTSGYNWEDGIGPKESRPTKVEVAWKAIEPNTFGLNEFMQWINQVGSEAIMTVNLGTKGIEDAKNIVEYCNFEGGSYWSDLRKSHGVEKPHNIKVWCLGNELDGEWQIARKTAEEYGRLACETAKVMRWVDPSLELVAVGSSARHLPTFPEWDRTVLMHTYEHADYLSLHHYINKMETDTANYLAMSINMERQIKEVIATCDYVQSVKRSKKTMYLSFDEWNIWRKPDIEYKQWEIGYPYDWVRFHMEDALVFGSAMLTLLRNADRVRIGCQSLLVNTIPMILTEKGGQAWRNPTYYPFQHVSLYGRGEVLRTVTESPKYDSSEYTDVPYIDSVTVWNAERSELTVFAINRSSESMRYELDIRDFAGVGYLEQIVLKNDSLGAFNTSDNQNNVSPVRCDQTSLEGGIATSVLDPYSWNVIRFNVKS
ncbi:arabinosylfuranosidase ArfA [Cohnella cholangitidis]|uniref:non-reducing end alpha-L-arabinofuranosidase n=1 Tax=Cohnella cholangitidis TaxID=2598458 RepID=A0A7G5C0B0_9BACL|nr:alpha-N-arabinofuranosidase [Cohnella cholangitidis]QMV42644.1 alpha-N-arabinofuranosidase [Cohnella cholangitidis]